jgi:hypothetical protein
MPRHPCPVCSARKPNWFAVTANGATCYGRRLVDAIRAAGLREGDSFTFVAYRLARIHERAAQMTGTEARFFRVVPK